MSCPQADDLALRLWRGALSLPERQYLRAHLAICPACQAEWEPLMDSPLDELRSQTIVHVPHLGIL
ncbi:MAG: putative zinc-finger [Holophagaceae bacterium]|nr:putative zinc-finger [Holophagaceae bacterium]